MERHEETFDVDTIRHYNGQWETKLLRGGEAVIDRPLYIEDNTLDFDGPITVIVDEYYTTMEGDMKVTVSWIEREDEHGSYTEDHVIEQVEVFE